MRIETETNGASRYARGGGGLLACCALVLGGVAFLLTMHAHDRISAQDNRVAAVERGRAVERRAALTAALSYDLVVERLIYLEQDVESCHGRWDATYSQMEDFWGVFIGGPIPPGKRYPLPNRPPAPPERLPADYCGLVALVPAAQALGACKPQRMQPPTMPELPGGRARRSARGIVGGTR
jgi:hypothetical protein